MLLFPLCKGVIVALGALQADAEEESGRGGAEVLRLQLLAEVVRRSDALSVMRQGAKSERGMLMAARDRKDSRRSSDEIRGKTS